MKPELVLALVISLVAAVVLINVGMLITANLYTVMSAQNMGISGNATRTLLFTNVWSSWNMSAILPIIFVAVTLIAAVGMLAYLRSE